MNGPHRHPRVLSPLPSPHSSVYMDTEVKQIARLAVAVGPAVYLAAVALQRVVRPGLALEPCDCAAVCRVDVLVGLLAGALVGEPSPKVRAI